MVEDHLGLLVVEGVAAQDVVVALQPLTVGVMVGGQVAVEDTHRHAVHLPPEADRPLVTLHHHVIMTRHRLEATHPVSSKAESGVLSLQPSDVGDVLGQAEQTQYDPQQTYRPDLDIAAATEVTPQPRGPGILPGQNVVRHEVLRLRLDFLQTEEDKVRGGVPQQGGERHVVRELDGHVPGDQLEAEGNLLSTSSSITLYEVTSKIEKNDILT